MRHAFLTVPLALTACTDLNEVGKAPDFSRVDTSYEVSAMSTRELPADIEPQSPFTSASTWSKGRDSLLGDQRASKPGDILTVVIDIDEGAQISNSTNRSRAGSENLGIPQFFGIPQRL